MSKKRNKKSSPPATAIPAPPIIFTIGAYGFTEEEFFETLRRAKVDTFCDIRRRRGMRGSAQAFANSKRLQARLSELGIRYLHERQLAPSPALRKRQTGADQTTGVSKRNRTRLAAEFIAGYREECLRAFNSREFAERLGPDAKRVVLFCVEQEPGACHRSLLAERLGSDLGLEPVHLQPA